MRNFKKFLALVLATLMVISAAATVSAYSDVADDNTYAAAINALTEYKIVNGTNTELDTFSPDDDVVRYQMALMMARALEPQVTDWQEGLAVFTDVNEWYGAIAYAYTKGIVTGIGGGQFAPKMGIKYQDALIMAVRALGYEIDTTKSDPYWIDAYKIANEIGLTKGVKVTEPAKTLTRAETAQVIYNMLKATPADGGATIEEKNFIGTGSQFVITATKKQSYAGATSDEAGVVGIQALSNGVPSGSIIYIAASRIGIAEADVEKYFNHTVTLFDFNEANGTFSRFRLGGDPDTVSSTGVKASDDKKKVTFNGVTYYVVSELTGAELKNEIILFNGSASATQAKRLIVDSNGVVYFNNEKVAIEKTENGVTYYMDLKGNQVISQEKALERYGVEVTDTVVTEYGTLTVGDLGKNYQLELYDDNGDGKYDRAYKSDVYMSVYREPSKDGNDLKNNIIGAKDLEGAKNVKTVDDKGDALTLTKGQVFVYTYNKALNTINVIDVLNKKTGVVGLIDLTDYSAKKIAKITIDGTVYTVGNTTVEGNMGANLCKTEDGVAFADIAKEAKLSYLNGDVANIIAKFGGNKTAVNYYVYNGYIISAENVTTPDTTVKGYMVVNKALNYDFEGMYLDAYVNGVQGEYYVTEFVLDNYDREDDDGKPVTETVKVSDLTIFEYGDKLPAFANQVEGTTFKYETKDGKSFKLVSSEYDDADNLGLIPADDGKYIFKNGISVQINNKSDRIRTDKNTVFYFVNVRTGKVSVTLGAPANDYFLDTTGYYGVDVYVDKLGFGDNDKVNGIAKTVLVKYNDESIKNNKIYGFDIVVKDDLSIVYLPDASKYTVNSADVFGLSDEKATDIFVKYNTQAINMKTGDKITVYSAGNILERGFYKVKASGVVSDKKVTDREITSADIKVDLDGNEYIDLKGTGLSYTEITKVFTNPYNSLDVKVNNTDIFGKGKEEKTVYAQYLTGDKKGTVVFIIGKDPDSTTGVDKKVNATWTDKGGRYVAIAETTPTAAKISGSVYVALGENGNTMKDTYAWNDPVKVTGKWADLKKATDGITASVNIYAADGSTVKYADADLVKEVKVDDKGVCTFSINLVKKPATAWEQEADQTFAKGNYFVKIEFAGKGGFNIPVTVK